jgi:hypothetical protein
VDLAGVSVVVGTLLGAVGVDDIDQRSQAALKLANPWLRAMSSRCSCPSPSNATALRAVRAPSSVVT